MQAQAAAKPKKVNFFMNPMIRKLSRVEETAASDSDAASYKGVAIKTMFFLLWAVIGIALFYIIRPMLVASGDGITLDNGLIIYPKEAIAFVIALVLSLIAPLLAFAIKPLVPVLGSIYCLAFAYSFACLNDLFPEEYNGLTIAALLITVALVTIMALLYCSGIVSVTQKFKTVVSTLFFTVVFGGLLIFLLSFIPVMSGLKDVITFFQNNLALSIGVSVVYIIIACLFLLVDFQTIRECVEKKMPKKYEWIGAFGLAYTIFYLFLQVFNLIAKIQNGGKTK